MVTTALVIPGWEAIPITLLCAGGGVFIGGSVSAMTTQKEIETIKSKMEKEQAKTSKNQNQYSMSAFIKKLTDSQAQNNIKIINEWMDKIEAAINNLCDTKNS